MKKIIIGVAIVIIAAIGFGVVYKATPTKKAVPAASTAAPEKGVTQVSLTATGALPAHLVRFAQ